MATNPRRCQLTASVASVNLLIRADQTDAILEVSSSQFNKDAVIGILETARYHSLHFRYPLFSFNNFVTYLECDKPVYDTFLRLFPRLQSLKFLDYPSSLTTVDISTISTVRSLSLNVVHLPLFASILSSLTRLDVFVDLHDAGPDHLVYLSQSLEMWNLTELNVFLKEPSSISYSLVVDIISKACKCSLTKLSLREIRRCYDGAVYDHYDLDKANGDAFIAAINGCKTLEHITIDVSILNYMTFTNITPQQPIVSTGRILSIIERSLFVPVFLQDFKNKLSSLIKSLGVSHINLQYGDPMSQSDLAALMTLKDFVNFFSETFLSSQINTVSMEQVWSIANEAAFRDYIHRKLYLEEPDLVSVSTALSPKSFLTLKPWHRSLVHTPNFRLYFEYSVDYSGTFFRPAVDPNTEISLDFWSVESSLMELEQYARRRRQRSNIWD
ncbi:hypothetical protein PSN45_000474 [Yamadazyma tenuis]|uniref:uncharacterized protein n=1 Tax=Candida tenuis TaxID=2315449 RepID=UPI00279D9DAB|nr:hypothetical protein PSN45_000474 [Yamadazyma tenuis]